MEATATATNSGPTMGGGRFLLSSLVLAAGFGASGALLLLGADLPATDPYLADAELGRGKLMFAAGSLGAFCGLVFVALTGLTSIWYGVGIAGLFLIGSIRATDATTANLAALATGAVMATIAASAYVAVVRRVRDVLGPSTLPHPWAATLCVMSLVPLLGTLVYWQLVLTRGGETNFRFSRRLGWIALGLVLALAVVRGAGLLLDAVIESDLTSGFFIQRDFDKALRNRDRVRHLNVAREPWNELPESIGELRRLESLNASGLGLTRLPASLGEVAPLERLFLSGNAFESVDPSIFRLTNLTHLNLERNRLTALAPEIGDLRALERLDLSHNALRALPEEIGRLTRLQSLDLMGNPLEEIPDSIGQLGALRYLCYERERFSPERLQRLGELLPRAACPWHP